MSDAIDSTQIHMPERTIRESKYKQCSHCGMFSTVAGKCPFCEKGEIR